MKAHFVLHSLVAGMFAVRGILATVVTGQDALQRRDIDPEQNPDCKHCGAGHCKLLDVKGTKYIKFDYYGDTWSYNSIHLQFDTGTKQNLSDTSSMTLTAWWSDGKAQGCYVIGVKNKKRPQDPEQFAIFDVYNVGGLCDTAFGIPAADMSFDGWMVSDEDPCPTL